LQDIGDINHDGFVNNKDVQALLDLLAASGSGSGGGGLTLVPEPGSIVLLALGGLILLWTAVRKTRLLRSDLAQCG
jgi:hypothetical protein